MHVAGVFLIMIGLLSGFHPIAEIPQNQMYHPEGQYDQIRTSYNIKPLSEFHYQNIAKQNYDFSCGSAALTTLLNYYLGEDFEEKQLIHGLVKYGDNEKIEKRRAFSLLDMKDFVKILGYKGVGYKAEIEDLKAVESPCIVPIKIFEYRHFTVLRGIYEGHVFLADPWKGNTSYTVAQFKDMWYQNILFVVYPQGAKELTNLKLKEQDLRFIDSDATRQALIDHFGPGSGVPAPSVDLRIDDLPGEYQFYKK